MEINIALWLSYGLWGLVVGLMVGFTAIGTGLLGTPGLIIFFGMNPVMAVGTMGFTGAALMLASVLQHLREKNIEWRVAGIFSSTALPASYLAAFHADAINRVLPLKTVIGTIILLSTGLLFYRYVIMKPKPRELTLPCWKLIVSPFLGLFLGILMGATSISGSIILIVFLLILKLPSPVAVGTTSALACVSLAVAAVAHLRGGHIAWLAVSGLLPGVVIGGTVGSRYVKRVPRQMLRYAILIILVIAGILVFVKG